MKQGVNMNKNKKSNNKSSAAIAIIPIIIILSPLLYSLFSFISAKDEISEPFYERPDSKYKECVRDTEYMRHHHWELLRAAREDVVRYGKRGEISLKKCGECHTSRDRFCKRCHDSVSMVPDCYGCHYYP